MIMQITNSFWCKKKKKKRVSCNVVSLIKWDLLQLLKHQRMTFNPLKYSYESSNLSLMFEHVDVEMTYHKHNTHMRAHTLTLM